MKYGDSRGIKTRQWFTNELLRQEDINRVGQETYQNFVDLLLTMSNFSSGAEVFKGLDVTFVTGLTAVIKAGIVISHSGSYMNGSAWGFIADPEDNFVVVVPEDQLIAFDTGVGQPDRIDTIEIRPVETSVDSVSRNFKDPVTGLISSAIVPTGKQYTYEMAIRKGSGMVPVATTAGWVKIAEVTILAGASSIDSIDGYTDSNNWITDSGATLSSYEINKLTLQDGLVYKPVNNFPDYPDDIASAVYFQKDWVDFDGWSIQNQVGGGLNAGGQLLFVRASPNESIVKTLTVPAFRSIVMRVKMTGDSGFASIATRINGVTEMTQPLSNKGDWTIVHFRTTGVVNELMIHCPPLAGTGNYDLTIDWIYVGEGAYITRLIDESPKRNRTFAFKTLRADDGSFFNNGDGYLYLTDKQDNPNDGLAPSDITMNLWFYGASIGSIQNLAFQSSNQQPRGLQITSAGGLRFYSRRSDGTTLINPTDIPITAWIPNRWNMITGVQRGKTLELYLNGNKYSEATYADVYESFKSLYPFGATGFQNIRGKVKDIRIYNKAIDGKTIKELCLLKSEEFTSSIKAGTAIPSSIAVRKTDGTLEVADAVSDLDAVNKRTLDETLLYDYIIDSNDSFAAICDVASASYKRVLVKTGEWTYTLSVFRSLIWDLVKSGTQRIDCEPGGSLVFISTSGSPNCIGRNSWSEYWDNFEYTSINDLVVKCHHASGGNVFAYLSNLNHCTVEYRSADLLSGAVATGYFSCGQLTKCVFNPKLVATLASPYGIYGFSGCVDLVDCQITSIDNEQPSTPATLFTGFENCTRVKGCSVMLAGSTYQRCMYAFYLCKQLSDCSVFGGAGQVNSQIVTSCDDLTNVNLNIYGTVPSALTYFEGCKRLASCSINSTAGGGFGNQHGFSNCLYLSSCYGSFGFSTPPTRVFTGCKYLTSCKAELSGTPTTSLNAAGFSTCDSLSSCEATITGGSVHAHNWRAFDSCNLLTGCFGSVTITSTQEASAFKACSGVVNCSGVATNAGSGAGYAFANCTQCQQNRPSSASKTATQNASFADTSTNAYAYTSAGGYNRVT